MQDGSDKSIPADVQEKILRFVRGGLAVALMRGKSYLGMGGVSMGIAGSIVDQPFFESYLGMRVETIDMTEFLRRMDKGIFDPAEYQAALKWTKENCQEGKDYNSAKISLKTGSVKRIKSVKRPSHRWRGRCRKYPGTRKSDYFFFFTATAPLTATATGALPLAGCLPLVTGFVPFAFAGVAASSTALFFFKYFSTVVMLPTRLGMRTAFGLASL